MQTFDVRGLAAILVLTAVVALQVPFFTCHSDCQTSCLPLWVLVAHHCHEVQEQAHAACSCHGHDDSPDEPQDHEPGDHELVFQQGVRAGSTEPLAVEAPVTLVCDVASAIVTLDPRARIEGTASPPGVAGPPGTLATVRLLL